MSNWLKVGYWRWFWKYKISARDKTGFAVFAVILLGVAGYLTAFSLTRPEASSAFITTERLVTVVHKTPGGMTTEVETVTDTLLQTGATELVTVVRNGRQVTLEVPGETVTSVETIDGKVVTVVRTKTRTKTNTRTLTDTQTVDHPVTVIQTQTVTRQETADPGQVTITETTIETKDVPGPTTTVTDTITDTVTQTETVTETVTEAAP